MSSSCARLIKGKFVENMLKTPTVHIHYYYITVYSMVTGLKTWYRAQIFVGKVNPLPCCSHLSIMTLQQPFGSFRQLPDVFVCLCAGFLFCAATPFVRSP